MICFSVDFEINSLVILPLSGCYEIQWGSCKHQPGFCVVSGPERGQEAALL